MAHSELHAATASAPGKIVGDATPTMAEGQWERLRDFLAFSSANVPYYRERASTYSPESTRGLADWARLPLLTKQILRMNFPHGLVADGIDVDAGLEEGRLDLAATSGTTGERLQVLCDLDLDTLPECFEALWELTPFGEEEVPRTAVFTTPTCLGSQCHLGMSPYEERIRCESTLYLNSTEDLFALDRGLIENILEELERFRPFFLIANPVYLHWLGRTAQQLGLPLPQIPLVLSTYQFLSQLQRRAITKLFRTRVYNFYSATDTAGCKLAIECARGRMHVRDDQSFVEVVGAAGPCATGQVGALVVTGHASRVMPLARYVVGDVGALTNERCTCAIADWPTIDVHGRAKDMLRGPRGWVTPKQVDDVLSAQGGLDFYQVVQPTASQLRVAVIPALGASESHANIASALRDQLGFEDVRVSVVSRVDPAPSLKFRQWECRFTDPPEFP